MVRKSEPPPFRGKGRPSKENAPLIDYHMLDKLLVFGEVVKNADGTMGVSYPSYRDLALRFNRRYGPVFTVPEVVTASDGTARVMDLLHPTRKMSKSADAAGSIHLLDPPDVLQRSIMRATTDSLNQITLDQENQPGVYNLLNIYQALTGKREAEILAEFEGKGYGHLKKQVAEAVISTLEPIQKRYHEMAKDPNYIEQILKEGVYRVQPIAEHRLYVAQKNMGLRS